MSEALSISPPSSPWGAFLFTILSLVLGSGGVTAWLKIRADRKQGIQSHELAEDEALARQWQAIVDTQVKALIEPLQRELAGVKEELARAKQEMRESRERLEAELATSRTKYWRAISYIRSLHLWISRHMPEGVEPPPEASSEILEDV